MNQKKSGRMFQKYSIKKLKVGAASVLVGAGFFLGFHVEASEINEPAINEVVGSSAKENKEKVVTVEEKSIETTPLTENKLGEEKNSNLAVEKENSTEIVEKKEQLSVERKATVETSQLADKMIALQEQVTRIRSNEKQKSFIEKAEKLLEEAKALQTSSNATQKEVDAKVKEISSLTSILKSIKAEETPKENKNQDSRNGKKMEEGVSFRIGTDTDATSSTASTSTGIGADVVDATTTPKMAKPDFTDAKKSKEILKQVTWLDFSDKEHWKNYKTLSTWRFGTTRRFGV